MKTKKSLGQHFLKSEKALRTIVETSSIRMGDKIVEIGPGTGALTERLLGTGCLVLAVEKDDYLFEFLKEKFAREITSGQLRLMHGDILNFEPKSYNLEANSYKLISNIPYNITGAILKKFLETTRQPERMVLLVQKEVAERIAGKPLGGSTSKWGRESILSISVKAYGKPRYIETVKAGSFAPMPGVDSAIIAIDNISKKYFVDIPEKKFFDMVRAGFKSKRKKLSSNLSTMFPKDKVRKIFQKLRLDENLRAENLGIETWSKLVSRLSP